MEAKVTDEVQPPPPERPRRPDEGWLGAPTEDQRPGPARPGAGSPGGGPPGPGRPGGGRPGGAQRGAGGPATGYQGTDYPAEIPGDEDEEAALEAELLAEIQRTIADLDEGSGDPFGSPAGAAGGRQLRGRQPGGRQQGRAPRGDMVPGEQPPGETALAQAKTVRLTAWLRGRVQGVGFRWWARSRALELGLTGWAENLADGRVKVVAEGPREACAQLLELLDGGDTPGQVQHVTHRWDAARGGLAGFAER
jgi:acylphosphatase